MKILKVLGIIVLSLIVLALVGMKVSGVAPLSFGWHQSVSSTTDYAINGFDPVAYFTDNAATKGSEEISLDWNESTWLFSSQENKALFEANPENYAPKCGGYCVFAVSKGFSAPGNPESWSIENGELLFYSDATVKTTVQSNLAETLEQTKSNWK
jgi:YHS domain-containing protein